MASRKKTKPGSLSEDINSKIEKESEDQDETRLDIVKSTLDDVNKVAQSPKIFIAINVVFLLVIIFMGRISILFVDPVPPTPPPDPEVKQDFLSSASRQYSPYYLSTRGSGVHVFGEHVSSPGSEKITFSNSLVVTTYLSRDKWKSISSLSLEHKEGRMSFPFSGNITEKDDILVHNLSGCNGSRCYIQIKVYPQSGRVEPGPYTLKGFDSNGKELFSTADYIATSDMASANDLSPIEFDVRQDRPGEMTVFLLSEPPEDFLRAELHSANGHGEVTVNRKYVLNNVDEIKFDVPVGTKSFKVYVTDFDPPFYDRPSKRIRVYGKFPGY